jgi:hypothetical protein
MEQIFVYKEHFLLTWDKNFRAGVNFAVQAKKSHVKGTNSLKKGTILASLKNFFDVEGTIFHLQGTFLKKK